jgi:hypothetical protein
MCAFFWVIPRASEFHMPPFRNTLSESVRQCFPKCRHMKFRRRGITQKKAHNIWRIYCHIHNFCRVSIVEKQKNRVSSPHVTVSRVVYLTRSEQDPAVIACKVLPVCWSIGSTAQLSCSTSRHWHHALILSHCPSFRLALPPLQRQPNFKNNPPPTPTISNFVDKLTHRM